MDVKLGELGTWLGRRDFTPNGIISAVRRGEDVCGFVLECFSRTRNHYIFKTTVGLSSPVFSLPGHERYYNKYINVKKGGIGGVAMLLVGYVTLSYIWEYDHISKSYVYLCRSAPEKKTSSSLINRHLDSAQSDF